MTKEIKITVTAPEDCTDEQFQEWIYFCLGYRPSISQQNPLCGWDLEAEDVDID